MKILVLGIACILLVSCSPSQPKNSGVYMLIDTSGTYRGEIKKAEQIIRYTLSRLDATDWLILRELQADGRITNVDLARKVGISAPPCLRRVRALEEAGIIEGFNAILNDKALGFDVTAFAMIKLHSQAEADLIAFEERVKTSPIVRDCHMLSGETDFVLRCVAPDLSAFQDFIIHELTAAPNVASVKTSLVIRTSKRAAGVPTELAAAGS